MREAAALVVGATVMLAGCSNDSTGIGYHPLLTYINQTPAADLRVQVKLGDQAVGTFDLPSGILTSVHTELSVGTIVNSVVLNGADSTVGAGSCTVEDRGQVEATIAVIPNIQCGCAFEGTIPCNPTPRNAR